MKKVSLSDVQPYDAPGHFGMTALRLHGKEETGAEKFWVGLSHFLPGGGAAMAGPPGEKAYFMIEGELTIETEDGEFTIEKNDLLSIEPGGKRGIRNKTNLPASMLVIYSYE